MSLSPTISGLSGAEPKPDCGVGSWRGHQDVGVLHIDGIHRTHWASVALTLQLLHELNSRRINKIKNNPGIPGCELSAGQLADLPVLSFPQDDTTVGASRDEMPLWRCNTRIEKWIYPLVHFFSCSFLTLSQLSWHSVILAANAGRVLVHLGCTHNFAKMMHDFIRL